MINLFLAKLAYKADNWAGDGKKILGYTFLAFCFLFPVVGLMDAMGVWGWLLVPYAFFCALAYRKWGAWGELWPDDDNDPIIKEEKRHEIYLWLYEKTKIKWFLKLHNNVPIVKKHKWFYRLIDKVYGKKYVTLTKEQRKQWKVLGWGIRYAIYVFPVVLLYSVSHIVDGDFLHVLTPLLVIPVAGIIRGTIYWYGLTNKNLKWCEQWGGAVAMALIVTSGM